MTKEIEESEGVVSSMRVTLRTGRRAGVAMIAAGVALSFAILALNRGFELVAVAILLISTAPAMIYGLAYLKKEQAKTEAEK